MRHHGLILVQGILVLRLFALSVHADLCAGKPSFKLVGDPTIPSKFYVCGNGTSRIESVGTCSPGFAFLNGNCTSTATTFVKIALTSQTNGRWVSDNSSFKAVVRAIVQNGAGRLWIKSGTSQLLVENLRTDSVSFITARVISHVATIAFKNSNFNFSRTDISVNWTFAGKESFFQFTPATRTTINYPVEPSRTGRRLMAGSKACCWLEVLPLVPFLLACVVTVLAAPFIPASAYLAVVACGVSVYLAVQIVNCFKQEYPCGGGPSSPTITNCFPADAILRLPSGLPLRMDHLAIGHRIAALPRSLTHRKSRPIFEDVYLFGHRDPYALSLFTSLTLANNATISLTPRHFIPVLRRVSSSLRQIYTYAKDVRPGDLALALDHSADPSSRPSSSYSHVKVLRVAYEMKLGLYNPFTMGGNIEVNGVIASTHSDWYLDDIVPASLNKYLPAVYQLSLMPVRAIYRGIGPEAMRKLDEKFDFAAVAPNGELWPYLQTLLSVASSLTTV